MYSFPDLEPVCCFMSSTNCCFLTCIQISQETGKVVWYSHLFKNFPQFTVIHTIKGFSVVSEAEVDVFLEPSCFFFDPVDVGNFIFGSSSLSAIRVVSSAYLRLLIFVPAILIPACASSSLAFRMMYSAYKLNKSGDKIQSWRTPFLIWNQSVVPCPVLTVTSWPAYNLSGGR